MTKFRIRHGKDGIYYPELKHWTTLWMWESVPDYDNVYSMFGSFGRMAQYSETAAKQVIDNYKNREAKEERIINVK